MDISRCETIDQEEIVVQNKIWNLLFLYKMAQMCFSDYFQMAKRSSTAAVSHVLSCTQQKEKNWINDLPLRDEEQ